MNIPLKMGIPEWEFRVVFGTTRIEYDPTKDAANLEKHGYSLQFAASLLERVLLGFGAKAPYALSDGFAEGGEVRHMHLCTDDSGKVVLMVTTMRPDESVRVISLRRASSSERDRLFKLTGYREKADL
ncbi:BrnT family toxin [Variovorax humicola]|uniref:BrnT family toxin n=1 Tax=Variovorax humicola TaxID=1769758 RepID=A0ABU8VWP4_9BURK